MTRMLLTTIAASLLAIPANAQTAEIQKQINDKLATLRTEDEQLKLILSQHPDVLVAQSKVQTAEAELAQVKMILTQRIAKLKATIKVQESSVASAKEKMQLIEQLNSKGQSSKSELLEAYQNYSMAQAVLAQSQSELKAMMPNDQANPNRSALAFSDRNSWLRDLKNYQMSRGSSNTVETGVIKDQLRKAILTTKTMNFKDVHISKIVDGAKDVFQLNFMIRMPMVSHTSPVYKPEMLQITLNGDLSFSGWMDLLVDELNSRLPQQDLHDIYIREYGLLFAPRKMAPQDAMTLHELTQTILAEEKVKAEKAAAIAAEKAKVEKK